MELDLRCGEFRLPGGSYAADYGTLRRPLRRGGGEVELPLIRLRHTGKESREPVFVLSGGPGTPNVYGAERMTEWGLRRPPFHWLLERHDLIAVGYRGAEGAPILDCPAVGRFILGEPRPLSRAKLRRLAGLWRDCGNEAHRRGLDPRDLTIVEVVDDLEAARRALGYGRVNLLAASYGTRLAWLYARRYPESVARMVLYGVNPPGHFVWTAAEVEAVLEHYETLWRDAGQRPAGLRRLIKDVLDGLPDSWRGPPLDADRIRLATFHALFRVRRAVAVFDAFADAYRGDYAGLAFLSRAWGRRRVAWGELAAKGQSADHIPGRDYLSELDPPTATLGSPLALLYWAPVQLGGPVVELIDERWRRHGPVDAPTLCLSGELDVATPPHWVDELLPHLAAGSHLVVEGAAHCEDLERQQPAAFARVVSAFLDEGRVVADAFRPLPVDFTPEVKLGALLEGP